MDVVNCSPSPAERRGGSTNRQPIAFKTDDGIRGAESPSMVTTASTLCASMPPQILARARSRRQHRRPSQSPLIVQACWNDRVRSRCAVRDSASCKMRRYEVCARSASCLPAPSDACSEALKISDDSNLTATLEFQVKSFAHLSF